VPNGEEYPVAKKQSRVFMDVHVGTVVYVVAVALQPSNEVDFPIEEIACTKPRRGHVNVCIA
jgi:hypothetical protein